MKATLTRVLIGLVIGLAIGLLYGWVLRPVEYVNTSPDTLRQDYRADYVLMVAEAFGSDGDIEPAQVRLAALGPQRPLASVEEALDYAIGHDFSQQDIAVLDHLALGLRSAAPTAEINSP
jgi:hypothetical protein